MVKKTRKRRVWKQSTKYVVLDTETTGLDAVKNSVLELGCVALDSEFNVLRDEGGDGAVQSFLVRMRPRAGEVVDKSSIALKINGHRWAADVASPGYEQASSPLDGWNTFVTWLERMFGEGEAKDIVPVGWNTSFDMDMLREHHRSLVAEAKRKEKAGGVNGDGLECVDVKPWPFHYHKIDVLGILRFVEGVRGTLRNSYQLSRVSKAMIPEGERYASHSALGDVYNTIGILKKMTKMMREEKVAEEQG